MLTLLLKFTFFNNRALQTRPIQAVNETLNKFLKERIDKAKYEASFSAYQSYIERVLAENPSVTKDKLRLLELCTKIHSIYNL